MEKDGSVKNIVIFNTGVKMCEEEAERRENEAAVERFKNFFDVFPDDLSSKIDESIKKFFKTDD